MREESGLVRALAWAMVLVHGCLAARQLLGAAGLARCYPLGPAQLVHAIWFLVGRPLLVKDGGDPGLDDLVFCVAHLLYGQLMTSEGDRRYVEALAREVLTAVYSNPHADVPLGRELIPAPPPDVQPAQLADWWERAAPRDLTLGALQLTASVEQRANHASAHRFLAHMFRLHETQTLESGLVLAPRPAPGPDLDKLRSAIDICLERLPPMLELGPVPQLLAADFNFPYHRPSIISMASADSDLMPESIGYVLLQECLWLNALLCHMRGALHALGQALVSGAAALPRGLLPQALALQEEQVPPAWLHPRHAPCTHSLTSWLAHLAASHRQLRAWLKRRMVPTFDPQGQLLGGGIARGRLTSVWLGGLANPQALLAALSQEQAVLAGKGVADMTWQARVATAPLHPPHPDQGGIYVTDAYLQGAGWNHAHGRLQEAREALFHLPVLHLAPVPRPDPALRSAEDRHEADTHSDVQGKQEGQEEQEGKQGQQGEEGASVAASDQPAPGQGSQRPASGSKAQSPVAPEAEAGGVDERDETALGVFRCPVYVNASRQSLVTSLDLPCPRPEEAWSLAGAALLLDPGLPHGASNKSRSYLLLQRLPTTVRSQPQDQGEEGEGEDLGELEGTQEGQEAEDAEVSGETESQLSYKPMTPQAPPLPEGLGLQREPVMVKDGGDVAPPLVRSRPNSAASAASAASASRRPRPPSQASTHSRGKEGDPKREEKEGEEKDGEEGKEKEGQEEKAAETSQGEDSGPRGAEPDREKLERQGEEQRGQEGGAEGEGEGGKEGREEEEKEVDEAEAEAQRARAASIAAQSATDAGAGHQPASGGAATPHPGDAPRTPKEAAGEGAGEREQVEARAEEGEGEAVREDAAGRGGTAQAEEEQEGRAGSKAAKAPPPADQRSSDVTERAQDSLHVEDDMKASGGESGGAAASDLEVGGAGAGSRPPTQQASRQGLGTRASSRRNLGLADKPPASLNSAWTPRPSPRGRSLPPTPTRLSGRVLSPLCRAKPPDPFKGLLQDLTPSGKK